MCNKFIDFTRRVYSDERLDCEDRSVLMAIAKLQFVDGIEVTPEDLMELVPIEGDDEGWAERLIGLGYVSRFQWDGGLFSIGTSSEDASSSEHSVRTEPTQFDVWWARYPRREAKSHAKKVYIGVVLDLSLSVFADSVDPVKAAEDYLLSQLDAHQCWLKSLVTGEANYQPRANTWLIKHRDDEHCAECEVERVERKDVLPPPRNRMPG